jgi:hypothetical protein
LKNEYNKRLRCYSAAPDVEILLFLSIFNGKGTPKVTARGQMLWEYKVILLMHTLTHF